MLKNSQVYRDQYEKLPQLPDSHFLPAMELNIVEKDVAARIKAHYNNKRTLIIGRTAHITGPLGHTRKEQIASTGICVRMVVHSALISVHNHLHCRLQWQPANLHWVLNSIVTEIIYDKETKKAKGVRVLDAETMQMKEYFSAKLFSSVLRLLIQPGY